MLKKLIVKNSNMYNSAPIKANRRPTITKMPVITRSMVRRDTERNITPKPASPTLPLILVRCESSSHLVCRSKPTLLRYEGFNITDTYTNRHKVRQFNNMIHSLQLVESPATVNESKPTVEDVARMESIISGNHGIQALENILDSLYSMDYIKTLLKKYIADEEFRCKPENRDIIMLVKYIKTVFTTLVKKYILLVKQSKEEHYKYIITNSLYRTLIKYDIITRNLINKFFCQVIWKAISFASVDGYMPGLLVIGHFYPDMVTDDCHPYINKNNVAYENDYFKLEEIKADAYFGPLYERFSKYC